MIQHYHIINIAGGYDRVECLKTVEYYDPEKNSWQSLPNMREARGRVQIAVLEDKIYAIGKFFLIINHIFIYNECTNKYIT